MTIADPNKIITSRRGVIGEIKAEMARKNITQLKLDDLTGKNQQYWSRRFTGATAFDIDDLTLLSDALQVPMWRFIPQPRTNSGYLMAPESPLSDLNRRPSLYIVDGSTLEDATWPDEEPKRKQAA